MLSEMVNYSNFETIAKQIEEKLIVMEKVKEELHKTSREIIKLSGQSIEDFHRKQLEKSKEKLVKAEVLISKISELLKLESFDPIFRTLISPRIKILTFLVPCIYNTII